MAPASLQSTYIVTWITFYVMFYRSIPEEEENVIVEVAVNLLNCDLHLLPVEVLLNRMTWHLGHLQQVVKGFVSCVGQQTYEHVIGCNQNISAHCGQEFGLNPRQSETCLHSLQSPVSYGILNSQGTTFDPLMYQKANEYRGCIGEVREKVQECLPPITKICQERPIRGFKTIRLKTSTLRKLFQRLPNLKVIHLMRDPRSVHSSRERHGVKYPGNLVNNLTETKMLCDNMAENVLQQRDFEQEYSDNFITIYFESAASDPHATSKEMYSFLQREVPSSLSTWLEKNTKSSKHGLVTSRNSAQVSQAWKEHMTVWQSEQILEQCSDVYSKAEGNPWVECK